MNWANRQDVKDDLYADVAILFKKNGDTPKAIDDTCGEIMKQVENYKQLKCKEEVRQYV
jgi:type I restriction enzyme R subunit